MQNRVETPIPLEVIRLTPRLVNDSLIELRTKNNQKIVGEEFKRIIDVKDSPLLDFMT